MNRLFTLTVALILSVSCYAQFSISGVITDSLQQPVPGATVRIAQTFKGTTTNNNGNYSLKKLAAGTYVLEVSYIGFQIQQKEVDLQSDLELNFELKSSKQQLDELIVEGTRVAENAPIAHTNISSKDFEKNNLGQDIPVLLQNSVSMVSTSDAGAGVGYTGFRLRGSDATRINVTVNGIPLNDAESQGVYWVNMPDFASSTSSIQIQRGVGASTNGAGAFGGSVNMQTDVLNEKAYGELSTSYGSFNTQKYTARMGTGLLSGKWAFDGRASYIASDGYIDRATSDLKSYYVSGGYYGKKTIVKAVHFAGKEKTYQSWWGTPESRITGNQTAMETHAANNWLDSAQTYNLLNSGRTYNYYEYDNETDNYQQDHYQLHISNQFSEHVSANIAFHYTYGRGYYEQYRKQDAFAGYGLSDLVIGTDTISSTDLIRRRWLDNDFYGMVYSLKFDNRKLRLILGGGYNQYDGDHFGEIIWAEFANGSAIRDRYYNNTGNKTDMNTYLKADYRIGEKLTVFGDLQVRTIQYSTAGIDNDLRVLDVDTSFVFFNPKGGLNYQVSEKFRTYLSVSVGNREPVRTDFIDNPSNKRPKHESMLDYEFGMEYQTKKYMLQTNFYFMDYTNQLVLTGELNDVGSPIRTNVDKSYRAGVELIGKVLISKRVALNFNTTFSQNKIDKFTEVLYDYTNGFEVLEIVHSKTDIAFSPNIIAAAGIEYNPFKSLNLMLQGKYVGQQYLDNTANDYRSIDAYYTLDGRLSYTVYPKKMKELTVNLLVNNITNNLYSSNGYTYSYIYGDLITENFFYPQAGTNFLVGLTAKF
ncbi:MAG: TonB-dependent receptor [Flavobacteriales bacterium]|nr:TonB-dependent receptor [Flavobacteriales bacterium]